MIVINTTRRTLLGNNVRPVKGFDDEAKGLLGATEGSSISFQTRWGIHTFGMKFSIDCVVLNNKFEVKTIRENLKPSRFFFWWPGYKNVLELPAGTILGTETRVGDILEMR